MVTFDKSCKGMVGLTQKCKVISGLNQKICKVFSGRDTLKIEKNES